MKTALFIRTWANPMSVRNSNGEKVTVPFQGVVEAEYDYLISMPGFEILPDPSKEDLNIVTVDIDTEEETEVSVWDYEKELEESVNKEESEEIDEVGLSNEDIKYLKGLTNFEWNKMKKVEVIDYLNKSNIDYSGVNDERWEYIKFLKKILKEM